jgi:CHAD domain-containing protein
VKAKAVQGLDPAGPFHENAARIVRTRLDELYAFDPAVRDARNVTELHDMRIAAKRLRYVLEIVGFAFGPPGKQLQREAAWLQEVLGEVHDCDVLIPLVDEHVRRLRDIDRDHLLAYGGEPAGLANAPNRTRYRGLEGLVAYSEARRQLRYTEFIEHWDRLLASQFRERVEAALK